MAPLVSSLFWAKNLEVTLDSSLSCTPAYGPFINCQFNCRNISRIQLHLPVVIAPPSLSMPGHAVRVTFLKVLIIMCLHRETQSAMTVDKGGLDSNHILLWETSSTSPLPAGLTMGLEHSPALCHLIYQMGIMMVLAYRVLVRIKWDDTCQVFSTRPSIQWMIVMMIMMKRITSFRIHL